MNNKINRLHVLAKDGPVTIHTRNLQVFATEIFKAHRNMSKEIMQGLFCFRQTHFNLRNPPSFRYSKYKFCLPWFRNHVNLEPRIWSLVPDRQLST